MGWNAGGPEGTDRAKENFRNFSAEFVMRNAGDQMEGLQPRKRHRSKAVQWVAWMDNALRQSLLRGWAHWRVSRNTDISPFLWPRITVAIDEGSGGKKPQCSACRASG